MIKCSFSYLVQKQKVIKPDYEKMLEKLLDNRKVEAFNQTISFFFSKRGYGACQRSKGEGLKNTDVTFYNGHSYLYVDMVMLHDVMRKGQEQCIDTIWKYVVKVCSRVNATAASNLRTINKYFELNRALDTVSLFLNRENLYLMQANNDSEHFTILEHLCYYKFTKQLNPNRVKDGAFESYVGKSYIKFKRRELLRTYISSYHFGKLSLNNELEHFMEILQLRHIRRTFYINFPSNKGYAIMLSFLKMRSRSFCYQLSNVLKGRPKHIYERVIIKSSTGENIDKSFGA